MSEELAKVTTALAEVQGDYREQVIFPNGYGVSIIRNQYSYGGKSGLFEVAVLDSDGELCGPTPVMEDVEGWLDVQSVLRIMQKVADLPAAIEA